MVLSIWFLTDISGIIGWMESALRVQFFRHTLYSAIHWRNHYPLGFDCQVKSFQGAVSAGKWLKNIARIAKKQTNKPTLEQWQMLLEIPSSLLETTEQGSYSERRFFFDVTVQKSLVTLGGFTGTAGSGWSGIGVEDQGSKILELWNTCGSWWCVADCG